MLMFIWYFDHFVFIVWGIDYIVQWPEASSSQLDNDYNGQMEPGNKQRAVI